MTDLMVDIETIGNGKNACIVQIGACYFERYTGVIGETFSRTIDIEDAMDYGDVDGSTLKWWFSQSKEAINQVMTGEAKLKDVFKDFKAFSKNAKQVWSHATFDFVIITNAYKTAKMSMPFGFRTARDIRTLTDLANIGYTTKPRVGTHHNALDDCKFQVAYCSECFHTLRMRGTQTP